MNLKPLLVLLMLMGFSFALIMSGDAGEEWSKQKANEMCAREDVASVYICLGNVVDVIWKDESKGSTFYKPDNGTVDCPPGAPSEMGAECMQLMMPNYCELDDDVCGEAPPEEFPGGVTEDEQPPVEEEPEVEAPPEEEQPEEEISSPPPEQPTVVKEPPSVGEGAPTMEGTFDNLVLIVVVLAVIALIVLYFVFKRTTGH